MTTPQEKLKEIEKNYVDTGICDLDNFNPQDIEWLISRVKELEVGLEEISNSQCRASHSWGGSVHWTVARRVLRGEK